MTMSAGEIKKSYMNAKNRKKQIAILAELNDCNENEIVMALSLQGIHMGEDAIKENEQKRELPAAVKEALEQKRDEIMDKLMKISEEMTELAKREEELTVKYSEISDYIGESMKVAPVQLKE